MRFNGTAGLSTAGGKQGVGSGEQSCEPREPSVHFILGNTSGFATSTSVLITLDDSFIPKEKKIKKRGLDLTPISGIRVLMMQAYRRSSEKPSQAVQLQLVGVAVRILGDGRLPV